jgi:peptidoglycan hydrolase-like protein with peptidoglycan-binding domain
MTPRLAQIALLSFALLAAGVTFNALVLQRKPGGATEATAVTGATPPPAERARKGQDTTPAGRGAQRTSEIAQPLRIARFAPQFASIDAMPEPADDEPDSATIAAIQRELKQRNYGPLPVDGILRPATRAAIMAFEFDRGLPLSGEANAQILKAILLGASAARIGAGAANIRSLHAEEIVRGVQKSLVALGYQSASPDGRLGEDTVKAIREFEMDRGLVPKGRVSADLLVRLSEAVAATKR